MELRKISGLQQVVGFQEKLTAVWYFKTWFEKTILILFGVSFVYSLLRIVVQGFW